MNGRVLAQLAISFLLGVLVSRWGGSWGYLLWLAWLGCVGWMAWRRSQDVQRKCWRRYLPGALRVVFCLIFCLLGQMRWEQQQDLKQSVEDCVAGQSELTVVGTVSKKEEKSWSIVYYLKNSKIIGKTGSLLCGQILIYQRSDVYSIGDTICVTGACESFAQARNEGNFDEREYYYSKGIFLAVAADSAALLGRQRIPWREWLYRLRKQVQEVYADKLPEREAGVLSVMTLGDKGMLDTELKKLYQQSGISHVLAISGLHVSILGMGIYRFLRKRRLSYLCAGLLAGVMVLLFGQVSGMELSTRRAVLMFLVMLLGNALGMAYDSVTALALSALLQLWENPYCISYAGFLFSYSAVLAVVVAVRILEEAFGNRKAKGADKKQADGERNASGVKAALRSESQKWRKGLIGTLFVSGCIQLVTLPLTVWFYYEFPLYSVMINGLLLPFMGLVLLSGLLGGLIGSAAVALAGTGEIALAGFAAEALERLSWLLLQPAYGLLRWNERVCSLFGRLPGAVCVTGKPGIAMMVAYYVVLAGGLFLIHRMNLSERIRGECSCTSFKKAAILAAFLISLALLLILRPNQGFRICFLDVGQGDGVYVQAEDGAVFFIDGGSTSEKKVGEYRILSFLKCQGAGHVDGWFVSHADEDHISGLLEVWESGYRVERLFLSQWIVQDEAWEKLCAAAEQYQTEITYLAPEAAVGSGALRFTCLYPWAAGSERNGNSMVLLLEAPGLSALLGGDLPARQEQELAKRYPKLHVELYKADHHGSNGSSSEALLQRIKPLVTVISCAEKNSYGHPGKEALVRITETGSMIYYTMESGQISVSSGRDGIWVETFDGEYKILLSQN